MRPGLAVASLAAAALLATACGGGAADSVGSDTSPTGPPTPTEQVVCFDGSYEPVEEGTAVPRDEACPESSPSASSSATPAGSWDVGAAFLPPEAAAELDPGSWAVQQETEAGPLFDPCGELAFPQADEVVASAERSMRWQEEASGSEVLQEVFRYSSADVAEQAFADYAAAVERCPQVDDEQAEGYVIQHSAVQQDEAGSAQRLLVRRQPCMGPDMCTAHFASYYLVAQSGDGLTAAHYGIYSDGDPAEVAPRFLAAVADQLARAVAGS